jgi:hypothetical protein
MTTNNDCTNKLETINFFLEEVIYEMKQVKVSVNKKDMIAYIAAWQNTLQTIKFMIN